MSWPLPEDIDATFPDKSSGDALHQQHHDLIHAALNAAVNPATGQLILPPDGGFDPGTVLVGSSAPGDPDEYDLWVDTSDYTLSIYVDGAWVELTQVGPPGPPGANGTNGTNGTNGDSVSITVVDNDTDFDAADPGALEIVVLYAED
jgi:hypothetical protein